jgi:hypothetical protein
MMRKRTRSVFKGGDGERFTAPQAGVYGVSQTVSFDTEPIEPPPSGTMPAGWMLARPHWQHKRRLSWGPFAVGVVASLIVTAGAVALNAWLLAHVTPWVARPVGVLSAFVALTIWRSAFRALRRPKAAPHPVAMGAMTLNEYRAARGLNPLLPPAAWAKGPRSERVDGDE